MKGHGRDFVQRGALLKDLAGRQAAAASPSENTKKQLACEGTQHTCNCAGCITIRPVAEHPGWQQGDGRTTRNQRCWPKTPPAGPRCPARSQTGAAPLKGTKTLNTKTPARSKPCNTRAPGERRQIQAAKSLQTRTPAERHARCAICITIRASGTSCGKKTGHSCMVAAGSPRRTRAWAASQACR